MPAAKREAAAHRKADPALPGLRACQIAGADRKKARRPSPRAPGTAPCGRLRDQTGQRRRFGCRRIFVLLRRVGEVPGINRICRLCREEGVTGHERKAGRKAIGTGAPILVGVKARWFPDLVHDQFACRRRFRVLDVLNGVTRECSAAIPDRCLSGRRGGRTAQLTGAGRGDGPCH